MLHLSAGNLYGGVETFLTTVARFRDRCPEMESHFGVCYEGRLSWELAAASAPVHVLGAARISRPWTLWRARRRLRELLRKGHFDIVICHMPWALVVFGKTVRASGASIIFWAHGFHDRNTRLEKMARRVVPDLAIANSHSTATSVSNLFHGVPVRVMYYPVALQESPNAKNWRLSVREKMAVEDSTAVILQVSRLEQWKGHFLHLHALAKLRDCGNWVCWIAGGPQKPEEEDYLRRLQQAASELGLTDRVRFLGQRDDVRELLAAADIFCQPNEGPEPFGIVFIEALWAGRPVVTTAMGGALEIVDESCGLLVDGADSEALAAQLRELIESPRLRDRLGRAGARRALQLCDPSTQLIRLKEISQDLIGSRKQPYVVPAPGEVQ